MNKHILYTMKLFPNKNYRNDLLIIHRFLIGAVWSETVATS